MDAERKFFSLTLKPSLTSGAPTDAAYLHALLSDLEAAEALTRQEAAATAANPAAASAAVDWEGALAIGTAARGSVHTLEEYGVVVDLEAHQVSGGGAGGEGVQGRPSAHSGGGVRGGGGPGGTSGEGRGGGRGSGGVLGRRSACWTWGSYSG